MSNNMPYGTLRDIASELKMIRKVLERMAQAPMFSKGYYITPNIDSRGKGFTLKDTEDESQ